MFEYVHDYRAVTVEKFTSNGVTYRTGSLDTTRQLDSTSQLVGNITLGLTYTNKTIFIEPVSIVGKLIPKGILALIISLVVVVVLVCIISGVVVFIKKRRANKKTNKSSLYEMSEDKKSAERSQDLSSSR